jgi:hypothetical protein
MKAIGHGLKTFRSRERLGIQILVLKTLNGLLPSDGPGLLMGEHVIAAAQCCAPVVAQHWTNF